MIPRKYDLVIGIPKSGMIPAYIIGAALGINVICLDKDIWILGKKNILLVDDSITSGTAIKNAKDKIGNEHNIDTAVVYTDRPNMNVNYFVRQIHAPRVFQWNIFKHGHLAHACIDLDGVLCVDPDIVEDDNKPDEMINHILNAKPLYIPKKEVLAIVTNRIEKYRTQTELWLLENKVKYKQLIMSPFESANERRKYLHKLGGNGFWKAQKFNEISGGWFIESNITQAKQIKSIINQSVFCTDTMQML
jgi:uncharacterized HAD superfamily protein